MGGSGLLEKEHTRRSIQRLEKEQTSGPLEKEHTYRFRQDILVVAALDERHHELVFLPAS